MREGLRVMVWVKTTRKELIVRSHESEARPPPWLELAASTM